MKQTEIGMIPDDWEVKKFDELFSMCTSTISSKLIKKSEYIGTENMLQKKRGIIRNELPIVYEKVREYKKDDILVSNIRPYLQKIWQADRDGGCSSDVLVFRSSDKGNYSLFLYNIVASDRFFQIVNDNSVGTKMPRGDKKVIKEIVFPLPPTLAEQQKIAKALSDVDNVISTLEKLITKKKNLKQGTMQQLLTGKKRLPGFAPTVVEPAVPEPSRRVETTKFKQTEIGEIPEDWEVVNIYKTCTIKARIGWQGLKSDEYLDTGDYVLVTGTDFDNGFINWKNCSYVSEWRYKQDKNIQIRKGDVLVTKDGTIGKIAFLNEIPMDGTLNSGVFVVRPKDKNRIDSVYLSLIFKSFWFDDFLEQITSGSTIIHLYQKDFVKFNFVLPEIKEQTAIANVLSSMDKEIEALNTKLEKYRNLKTGMMQQLLTGKIRLI